MTLPLAARPAPRIRLYLLALVLLAVLPLAALLGYRIYAEAQANLRQAQGGVERLKGEKGPGSILETATGVAG